MNALISLLCLLAVPGPPLTLDDLRKGADNLAKMAKTVGEIDSNLQEALRLTLLDAEKGDATAMATIGRIILERGGLSIGKRSLTLTQGLSFAQKSAARENPDGLYLLGDILCYPDAFGAVLPEDLPKARSYYERAARKGQADAMVELGNFLELGKGKTPVDLSGAVAWFEKAAATGSVKAMIELSEHYRFWARPAIPEKALFWRAKAGAKGDVASELEVAKYYLQGYGSPKDPGKAIAIYERLISRGNAEAGCTLASLSLTGSAGVPKDEARARKLIETFAAKNDGRALTILGEFFEKGQCGLPKDPIQAYARYLQAAQGGYGPAMVNVGVSLMNGSATAKDPAKAFEWFQKAADKLVPAGLFNLAVCYEIGLGCEKNIDQAKKLYAKAKVWGHPKAQAALDRLKG